LEAILAGSDCFSELYSSVEADFQDRLPEYHKSRREGLSVLASVVLNTRSVNLMENASALPREIVSVDHRYQYISRLLGNSHIDTDEVMQAYVGEIFRRHSEAGETIVLALDQSKINEGHEVLMLSVRMRDRALPVAWRVRKTKGPIGWRVQHELLEAVRPWLPEGAHVLLAGDRFYGTARLIEWCHKAGWDYRLRLKSNLTLQHQGGEVITREIAELMPEGIVNAELNATGVLTNIGVLQEDGHKEPWIIAMSVSPSEYKILDYGMRWSIEAMFSDFKTRGFGITQSQIKKPDRLARLILVLAIAMYWAVSTGATEEQNVAERGEKRGFEKLSGPCAHSLKQAFALSEELSLATQKSPSSGRFG
tara:strand:- start:19 stop:1113 length:1095 start_codon:yes stop_codon:yes gene_type:complete